MIQEKYNSIAWPRKILRERKDIAIFAFPRKLFAREYNVCVAKNWLKIMALRKNTFPRNAFAFHRIFVLPPKLFVFRRNELRSLLIFAMSCNKPEPPFPLCVMTDHRAINRYQYILPNRIATKCIHKSSDVKHVKNHGVMNVANL